MSDKEPLKVVGIDRVDGAAIIVDFSDNTTGIYTTDQLTAIPNARVDSDDFGMETTADASEIQAGNKG
jgi:hypothetical protein